MAATLPGVLFIQGVNGDPSGISVLGLDQDQNDTSLNGLNSDATDIPRDANVSVNLATSPYDVSQGQFSGGRINIRTSPGSNYINRSVERSCSTRRSWSGPTAPAARSASNTRTRTSAGRCPARSRWTRPSIVWRTR